MQYSLVSSCLSEMPNLPVMLEVLIGLAIIFLALSVFVAGIQEFIASLLQWRAKHLEASILLMMTKQYSRNQTAGKESDLAISLLTTLYGNDLVQSMNHHSEAWLPRLWRRAAFILWKPIASCMPGFMINLPGNVTQENVDRSGGSVMRTMTLPSHLEPETFASALIQEVVLHGLKRNQQSNGQDIEDDAPRIPINKIRFNAIRASIDKSDRIPASFQKSLRALVDRAESKSKSASSHLHEFQQEVEDMFSRSMQRATGVYKRNAQLVCFAIGLLCSILLNVDSVDLVSRLHRDNTLREALSNSAPELLQSYKNKTGPEANHAGYNIEHLERDLGATLPIVPLITYDNTSRGLQMNPEFLGCTNNKTAHGCSAPSFSLSKLSISKLLGSFPGWLITAFAIYMGAPFWFEILGKLVQVRSIGKTSEKN